LTPLYELQKWLPGSKCYQEVTYDKNPQELASYARLKRLTAWRVVLLDKERTLKPRAQETTEHFQEAKRAQRCTWVPRQIPAKQLTQSLNEMQT